LFDTDEAPLHFLNSL